MQFNRLWMRHLRNNKLIIWENLILLFWSTLDEIRIWSLNNIGWICSNKFDFDHACLVIVHTLGLWIEPNGNIPTINESSVIYGPIGCAVDFVCRLLHLKIILLKKPSRIGLCNKATSTYTSLCNKAIINIKKWILLKHVKKIYDVW